MWDGVWKILIGSEIVEVTITENSSVIKVKKRSKVHVLETPQPGPVLGGGNEIEIKANHLDVWIVSRSGKIYC
jgi:hypothetical protein